MKIKEKIDIVQSKRRELSSQVILENLKETHLMLPSKSTYYRESSSVTDMHTAIFEIPENLVHDISDYAKNSDIDIQTVFFTSWLALLHRYSGSDEFFTGYGMDNDCKIVAPIYVDTKDYVTCRQGMEQVQHSIRQICERFTQTLLNDRDKLNNSSRARLQTGFFWSITGGEASTYLYLNNESLCWVDIDLELLITLMDSGKFVGKVCYRADEFERSAILRMTQHYLNILLQSVKLSNKPISQLSYMTEEELNQVLTKWNDTGSEYPAAATINELFSKQAEKTPDAPAIAFEGATLTYSELNVKSNQLARVLRSKGAAPDSIVGIMVERSLEMIIGILGILKAGGAYLPIDPDYPKDRIEYMLADSGTSILLTQKHLKGRTAFSGEILELDNEEIYTGGKCNPEEVNKPGNLAYVIYTSGSTGRPKGVMIEHKSVVNILTALEKEYPVGAGDCYLLKTAYIFDVSVTELFGWFIGCGRLEILPQGMEKDPKAIIEIIKEKRITHINFVPSMLKIWLEELSKQKVKGDWQLKYVMAAGEALQKSAAEDFYRHEKQARLENIYGPTEITIYATKQSIEKDKQYESIPIGKPMANTRAYIVDANNNLQPVGVAGEICIAGDGLARGYLNKPDLTAEKFVNDPFLQGSRMYRTGDLGRWLPDGSIEYLGRIDQQVKIRGFRVELGEIEAALMSNGGVQEAVAVVYEETPEDKRLAGYVVLREAAKVTVAELKSELQARLPEYMVPATITVLERIPLTASGKINRKALPKPEYKEDMNEYVEPVTATEEQLAALWEMLLNNGKVGRNSQFFNRGGHSLLATKLVSHIREKFQVELNVSQVFHAPVLWRLAEVIDQAAKGGALPPIMPRENKGDIPLSSSQQRLWFIQQLQQESHVYNVPMAYEIKGRLDIKVLEQALNEVVRRHESLRTVFRMNEYEPVQHIMPELEIGIELTDASETEALRMIKEQSAISFDLTRLPLFRVNAYRFGQDRHFILLNMHHIITDGWSISIFAEEWFAIYDSLCRGEVHTLQEPMLQYGDYSEWQREWLKGVALEQQENYWKSKLEGAPALIELPTDYWRPSAQSFKGDLKKFDLSKQLSEELSLFSKQEGVTLYMTLLSMWAVLLYRYSGQNDFLIGSPIANRTRKETENIIGFFVNTLAIRVESMDKLSFRQVLKQVMKTALEAYMHQDLPFDRLVELLQPERNSAYAPLCQVMFVLQSDYIEEKNIGELQINPFTSGNGTSKFDLMLEMIQKGNELIGTLEYSTDIFAEATAERILTHFKNLIRACLMEPDKPVSQLGYMTEEEFEQVLVKWNDTGSEYPTGATINGLFSKQAEKTPDAPAITFEGVTLTYSELNVKSNQLARVLRSKGAAPDGIVGIMVERSLEMIIGILGILKAGGAYLPIDPDYPKDRIEYMLADSGTGILLTQKHLKERTDFSGEILELDNEEIYTGGKCNLEAVNKPGNLAYVIYTSGSTGRPKGVMIEHKSVVNILTALEKEYPVGAGDCYLLKTAYIFDVSVTELFGWFIGCGRLEILPPGMEKDPKAIIEMIKEKRITHINFVPSMLKIWLEELSKKKVKGDWQLKYVMAAGEALQKSAAEDFYRHEKQARLENIYGPTEITIYATKQSIEKDKQYESIPIGKPMANTRAYIVDANNNLQPAGIAGEICIAGDGLARGYLNKPELTAEKFVDNPFEPEARMYRTGDSGRWLPDGSIEYLGRIDQQVKIRGFRVELGEIEAALMSNGGVQEAVAVVYEETTEDKRLAGYVVLREAAKVTAAELKSELQARLPEYMVPATITVLERIPLTASGKINRKALPKPEYKEDMNEYVEPVTATEEQLAALWEILLNNGKVGRNSQFFNRGGHSLLATKLVSHIREKFQVELNVSQVFHAPVLRKLAEEIDQAAKGKALPPIMQRENKGDIPLSSSQQRLWFIQQLQQESHVYNVPMAYEIKGRLDIKVLEQALNEMTRRHESLRTVFRMNEYEPVQHIIPELKAGIELTDGVAEADALRMIEQQSAIPFDLTRLPLFRVNAYRLSEDRYFILLNMHHIITDGWSMNVFAEEWFAIYDSLCRGEVHGLQEPVLQYGDYSEWQREWLKDEALEQQENYWNLKLEGAPVLLELPTDYRRKVTQSFKGDLKKFNLSKQLSEELSLFSKQEGATLYMTLLSMWAALLYRYSGQNDFLIGSPIANRTRKETENIIGFFVNTLAIRVESMDKLSFRQVLKQVMRTALEAYMHQDLPFDRLVELLQPERSSAYAPLCQVMFVLQSDYIEEKNIGELQINPFTSGNGTAKFDLTLEMIQKGNELIGTLEYSTDIFAEATVERMLTHFGNLIHACLMQPDKPISQLGYMTEEELNRALTEWNDTRSDYPAAATINGLFEEQAEKTPDNVAIAYEGEQLTYRELNARANQLARVLRGKGVAPDSIVGIMVERSFEMIIGILGILKAGSAYLPIDPDYPKDRIEYMLADSGTGILLTQKRLAEYTSFSGKILELDNEEIYTGGKCNPEAVNKPGDIAYVIYTSGSTGRPKGVMIEHKSVVNILTALEKEYPLGAGDCYLLKTAYIFDVSVTELFGWFIGCGRLEILPQGMEKDPKAIIEIIKEKRITHINFVPSMLKIWLEELSKQKVKGDWQLKYVMAAGEALQKSAAEDFYRHEKQARLENIYGPTEITIYAIKQSIEKDKQYESIPIGKPMANTRIYIVDTNSNLQPVGVAGEICIAGDGLARGYLNKPELTAEKFVDNPFLQGSRMYKTGDSGRWLSDGSIEFLGRIDQQVKIRGFRVELGEIEAALMSNGGVQEAVAVVYEEAPEDERLAGYVVLREAAKVTVAELKSELQARLPEYMVPATITVLEKIPLTASGKINRKALPKPEYKEDMNEYVRPVTVTEEQLAVLWEMLLNNGKVGRNAQFFNRGGHSLLATKLISHIREKFQVEFSVSQVFHTPVLWKLACEIDQAAKGGVLPPITPREDKGDIPLSFAQQRLWFIQQLQQESHVYNVPMTYELIGRLDIKVLEQALNEMVRRHESLRTVFRMNEYEPVQHIMPELEVGIELTDGLAEADALRMIEQQSAIPFDLTRLPLFGVNAYRLSEDRYFILLNMHHIITDGWSTNVFIEEWFAIYDSLCRGEAHALREPVLQYSDYSEWQREWLKGVALEQQENYWKSKLEGAPTFIELPTDYRRKATQSFKGDLKEFNLSKHLSEELSLFSKQEGATLYMTLLSIWAVLLYRYSGQNDFLIGSPIANRTRKETENIIGFFVNTLAIRVESIDKLSFRQVLKQVMRTALEAYMHQDLPFDRLVELLQPERNSAYAPLCQVMFVLQSEYIEDRKIGELQINPFTRGTGTAKVDLMLEMIHKGNELIGTLEYSTDIFAEPTAERMLTHFKNLIHACLMQPDMPISQLSYMTEEELKWVLTKWNDTGSGYPAEATINELFSKQAEKTPDAPAITFEGMTLTYSELNARANRLARYLQKQGVSEGMTVGIGMERSVEIIVGTLAVLKAGGVCVLLEPNHPKERLKAMVEDTGLKMMLTQKHIIDVLPAAASENIRLIILDKDEEAFSGEDCRNLKYRGAADNLAYVIFTSGSTGRPKGVALPHRGFVRLVKETNYAAFRPDDVMMLFASVSFDASVLEIWSALLNGGLLTIFPPHKPSLEEIGQFIEQNGVTSLWLTAGLFHQMVDYQLQAFRKVRQLMAGGDVLSVPHVQRVLDEFPGIVVINGYGPTENSAFTACYPMTHETKVFDTVPIGFPIANTRVYVLDEYGQPVPIGVWGELHAAGDGLAREYIGRPELTAEKFVSFETIPGERLYRTGDKVRWKEEGILEFLGRIDQQVKIRGFRVELGEIEAALVSNSDVQEAVVVVHEETQGDKRLAGYVVLREAAKVTVAELKFELQVRLPEYMVPATITVLERMPLTANGKIDRRALPKPEYIEHMNEYVEPVTATEEQLAVLWEMLLNTGKIGRNAQFFDRGGHSLLATKLISHIQEKFQAELSVSQVFHTPVLWKLACEIDQAAKGKVLPPIMPREVKGDIPLSSSQQRLWFIQQLQQGSHMYNSTFLFKIKGKLNCSLLEQALNEMIRRHESLRTIFPIVNQQPVQRVLRELTLKIHTADFTRMEEEKKEGAAILYVQEQAAVLFALDTPPLLRAYVVKLEDELNWFVLNKHHIITDGWSINVFIKQLLTIYDNFVKASDIKLPMPSIQYADFSQWQNSCLREGRFEDQKLYWRKQLENTTGKLELPTDYMRPVSQSFAGSEHLFTVTESAADSLKKLCIETGTTPFMALLAVWAIALYRYSGQNDIVIGTPIANRTRNELEEVIGFFVNTLALRFNIVGEMTFYDLLLHVRNVTLGAYANQDIPFDHVVDMLNIDRNLSYSPLFQVMFTLQTEETEEWRAGGTAWSAGTIENSTSKFDLTMDMKMTAHGIEGTLVYNTGLFTQETAGRMAEHFQKILYGVVESPKTSVSEVPILTDWELQQISELNNTYRDYPLHLSLADLMEEQAAKTPDKIALIFEDTKLTFRELNEQSDRLARYLQDQGALPDTLVGVCMERSIEMIIALLAVIKSGAAYIPIDPDYPEERIKYILQDAGVAILLSQRLDIGKAICNVKCIFLDEMKGLLKSGEGKNIERKADSSNLAYVMYTSGTTGQPKGVMITHRALCNRLLWMKETYTVCEQDRIMQKTPLSFDVSVWELFLPMITGATLIVAVPHGHKDTQYMVQMIKNHQITMIHFIPSMLQLIVDEAGLEQCTSLRFVFSGGEALPYDLYERLQRKLPVEVHNRYGPTEITINATYWPCEQNAQSLIKIGRPLANTQCYVLNADKQPVPLNVPGELYVGGVSLARGYLNCQDLTREKFIPDRFSDDPEARLYRTGDLVRYTSDGQIEFLGRVDHQIKIRGFRIELEEIEKTLCKHPEVQDAVVIVKEQSANNKKLVAYVTPKGQNGIDITGISKYLEGWLPEYMLPSIVELDKMPLTVNGKADRKALEQLEVQFPERSSEYIEPKTESEKQLAAVIKELLQIENVGTRDNIFRLGANSLILARIAIIMRENFGVDIPLRVLFEKPTIDELAAEFDSRIESREGSGYSDIDIDQLSVEDMDELLSELLGEGEE